jgi:hypothetical protein
MNRRSFLLLAAAASAATLSARQCLAASTSVASVRVIPGPRQLLVGAPGRCAGARRLRGIAALIPFPSLA